MRTRRRGRDLVGGDGSRSQLGVRGLALLAPAERAGEDEDAENAA